MKACLEKAIHAAWQTRGVFSIVMTPLSCLYDRVLAARKASFIRHPERIHHDTVPVLVVGNIYIGGTGKTPVVIALVRALQSRGWRPGVVSRGYGTRASERPRCGSGELDARLFGDEPALIAVETGVPISVHPDRPAAIRRLRRQFPEVDVVISDDGLQHLALGRDMEIVVQDVRGVGNGRLLPAGPLREPVSRLYSVDFIVNNLQAGESPPAISAGLAHVVTMTLEPHTVEHLVTGEHMEWAAWLAGPGRGTCAAVAAIGRPDRFFTMLRQHGQALAACVALPDHDDYQHPPFASLTTERVLVTPKDAIKCRQLNDPRLYCVHPHTRFSEPGWLDLVDDLLRVISTRKQTAARAEALHLGL